MQPWKNNCSWKIWKELSKERDTPLSMTKGKDNYYQEWERKIMRVRKEVKENPQVWNATVRTGIRGD